MTSSGTVTVTSGTFTTNNFNVTATSLVSNTTNTRAINLGSSTVTLSGSGSVVQFSDTTGMTFNAGTSTIVLSSSASPNLNVAATGLTFYDVSFTGANPTQQQVSGANTFRNLTIANRTSSGIKPFIVDANQIINGTLTLSAGTDATMRTFVRSDTLNTARTLTCAAVASLTDIDFRDITIAGAAAPVSGTRLGDCKGNSGITFGAGTTKYWNLPSGGNWSATGWATSSGGTPAANNFPLAQDTCIFEATGLNSGTAITIIAAFNIGTIDMSARTSNTMTLVCSQAPQIYGNWINGTGVSFSGIGTLTFAGRGSQTITSAGVTFTQSLVVNSLGGSVTLQDAYVSSRNNVGAITVSTGTFNANNYNVTLTGSSAGVTSTSTTVRTLAIGSGTWTLPGISTWNVSNIANLTVTGTGTISLTSASTKTFAGGGIQTYPTLSQGGTGTLTVSGSNKFAGLTNTAIGRIQFTGGATNEFTSFTINGVLGNLLQLGSSSGTQAILIKPTAWLVGANSTDGGNNTGLSFTAGGGIDYLSVSYINGVVSATAISASISETSTASDAVAAFLTFLSSTSETATATDTVGAAGSTYNPSLSESATATDAITRGLTLLAQVADAATVTDTTSVQMVFSTNLAETATATDAVFGSFVFASVILESATATDTTQAAKIFLSAIAETATATDLASSLAQFLAQIAETSTVTDVTLVAPSVFGAQVQEAVAALDLVSAFATFNVQFVDSATALDAVIGAFLWNVIDDGQNANWVTIATPQAPTWTSIDDSQPPGWQNINTV